MKFFGQTNIKFQDLLLSGEKKDLVLELIETENLGEDELEFEKEWELLSEIDASTLSDDEHDLILAKANRFNSIISKPDEESRLDTDEFTVRYKYLGPHDKKNRDFCDIMMTKKLIFRQEDIHIMSFKGVNGSFAKKGQSKYSIFKYVGGKYCRHRWSLREFKKKK